MQIPSNIVPILLLYLAYGINCKTDLPINLTVLECPEDFIAIGHAWIGPMIYGDATKLSESNERANYKSKNYHELLEKKSYKSEKFGICLICNHLNVELEVCSTNSRIFYSKLVHYEKEYGAFNLTDHNQDIVDWYNKSDVCAISFQQQNIQLSDALLGMKPIQCQQKMHHIEHNKVSQKTNESYFGLMCPNDSVLESFENRNTLSESEQSTCIVCSSLFQKYSLCFCKNCSKKSNAVDYVKLAVENSSCYIENKIINYFLPKKCPINEIGKPTTTRLFCGYQFHFNYNSSQNLSQINSTQLLYCDSEKKEDSCEKSSSGRVLGVCIPMILLLVGVVGFLIKKIQKAEKDTVQQQTFQARTYTYSLNPYYGGDDRDEPSSNQQRDEPEQAESNYEFSENPYYDEANDETRRDMEELMKHETN